MAPGTGDRDPVQHDHRLATQRWMVGDAPGPDVGGARLLGLRTAWLHRGRTWDGDDGPRPDVVVGSVAEAVDEILAAAPAADDADDAG